MSILKKYRTTMLLNTAIGLAVLTAMGIHNALYAKQIGWLAPSMVLGLVTAWLATFTYGAYFVRCPTCRLRVS